MRPNQTGWKGTRRGEKRGRNKFVKARDAKVYRLWKSGTLVKRIAWELHLTLKTVYNSLDRATKSLPAQ